MPSEWLLIDGSSLIFRAYYGALASARASRTDANPVGGFLDRLARLVADRRPRRLVIADDSAWRPQWRVDLIADYKAHRVAEPVPPGLMTHLPVITQLLEHIGIDVVGVADYEAEDVIATLTRLAPGTVDIASGDRDLFALVEDPRVRVLYPERSGLAVIDETEITRRYAIPGRRYADFAILRGDPSDGLPGLRGVGAVTAAAMIRRHGDIAGVLRDRPLRPADREYLANETPTRPTSPPSGHSPHTTTQRAPSTGSSRLSPASRRIGRETRRPVSRPLLASAAGLASLGIRFGRAATRRISDAMGLGGSIAG
jgi:5'-3' exonuclease